MSISAAETAAWIVGSSLTESGNDARGGRLNSPPGQANKQPGFSVREARGFGADGFAICPYANGAIGLRAPLTARALQHYGLATAQAGIIATLRSIAVKPEPSRLVASIGRPVEAPGSLAMPAHLRHHTAWRGLHFHTAARFCANDARPSAASADRRLAAWLSTRRSNAASSSRAQADCSASALVSAIASGPFCRI